jgi:hypothetical protein
MKQTEVIGAVSSVYFIKMCVILLKGGQKPRQLAAGIQPAKRTNVL